MRKSWAALPAPRRTIVILVAAGVLAGVVFISQWLLKDEYAPLFTNLETQEAAQIVNKLKEQKVPYKLDDGGATILVPQKQLYDLRLTVAGSGLLAGSGVGFELFDKTQMGMTDAQWHLNYQRALQEELRRTITQYDQVEQARIHLVIPEPSVFLQETPAASAAVVLTMRPLARLSSQQVKSIMYLVSSSVEGMKAEAVKVVDTQGNVLSDGVFSENDQGTMTLAGDKQQEMKRQFEQGLEQRVQQKLETIMGPGEVVVMVTGDLDFDQREQTRITYDNTGVVRSEQLVQETNGLNAASGAVGDANRVVNPLGSQEEQNSQVSTTRNYEIGQVEEKVVYAPGRLQRLTTSVVVNGPVDLATQQQIQDIVAAATGFNSQRGDQISVTSMAFDRTGQEKTELDMALAESQARQARFKQYLTFGALGAALLLALIVGLAIARRRTHLSQMELAASMEALVPVEEVQTREGEHEAQLIASDQADSKLRTIQEIVRERPGEAADLLKAWLGGDSNGRGG